jgi:hypothetical protein
MTRHSPRLLWLIANYMKNGATDRAAIRAIRALCMRRLTTREVNKILAESKKLS